MLNLAFVNNSILVYKNSINTWDILNENSFIIAFMIEVVKLSQTMRPSILPLSLIDLICLFEIEWLMLLLSPWNIIRILKTF